MLKRLSGGWLMQAGKQAVDTFKNRARWLEEERNAFFSEEKKKKAFSRTRLRQKRACDMGKKTRICEMKHARTCSPLQAIHRECL